MLIGTHHVHHISQGHDAKDAWYLDYGGISPSTQTIKNFFMYFALLSFLIPMSLMVTLEVVKVWKLFPSLRARAPFVHLRGA